VPLHPAGSIGYVHASARNRAYGTEKKVTFERYYSYVKLVNSIGSHASIEDIPRNFINICYPLEKAIFKAKISL